MQIKDKLDRSTMAAGNRFAANNIA